MGRVQIVATLRPPNRWNDRVSAWTQLARKKGVAVEFV